MSFVAAQFETSLLARDHVGVQFEQFQIRYLRHSRVNHMHLDGVFLAGFLLFAKHVESNFNFFTHKGIQRLFILEFCSRYD